MKDFNCIEDTQACLFYGLQEFIKSEFDASLARSGIKGQVIIHLLISKSGQIEHMYIYTLTSRANSKFLDKEAKIKKELVKVFRKVTLTGKAEGEDRINSQEFMFRFQLPFKFNSE